MTYRVAYSDLAKAGRAALSGSDRKVFDARIGDIARDPYGCGSNAVGGSRDRRDVGISSIAVVRYEVSASVVTVTILRVI